tara:strand:- start:1073 stop:2368 length:1296 start_codon:yes stop_codon:yes gene_type:complete
MKKIIFSKYIKNNLYLVLLISLTLFTILSTYFFTTNKKSHESKMLDTLNNTYLLKSLNHVVNNLNPRFVYIDFEISEGDTFEKILNKLKIPLKEKEVALSSLSKFKFVNNLYKGQNISFKLDKKDSKRIIKISFERSKIKSFVFKRIKDSDKYEYKQLDKKLDKVLVYKESEIINSLYSNATKINIPPSVIIEFARIYGFQVDFQRDIWKHDRFQIIYETFLDSNNMIIETGNILYANLILQGKENDLYIFKTKKGYEHFDKSGKSVKKSLMKTPINGARLSSSFGVRKHPILGYNKMHRGTDFAAPEGTPVMASGDGKVVRAKWCGGGGNCIKINHNSTYSTVYAHLKNFARGIKEGVIVKQGQTIGYVGSTGMSTGPHLHYEVIINGKKVNSQTLKLPSGKILKGKNRKLFEVNKIKLNVLKSKLISSQ